MLQALANYNFSGNKIVVIGASRGGIGASIARAFQDAGADVEITGVEKKCIPEDSGRFCYTQLDITDNSAIESFAARKDRINVLVNCAAITQRGKEMDPNFFSHVLDVNLSGTYRCSHALKSALTLAGGTIINIASMYARFGSPKNPAYGASKAAIEQLTKSLAIAWAIDGVRVNAIAPGFIITEQSAPARRDLSFVNTIEARTPLARWGHPEDVSGTALFLASKAASFITGVCIPVDGGYSVV